MKHFWDIYASVLANAVSVMSNILATFLREACPHVGAHFWVRLPVAYLYSFLREAYSHIGHVSSKANINVIVLRLANDDYRAHFRVGLPAIRHIRHNGTAHVTPLLSGIHFWLVCRRIVWHVQDMNQI